MSQSRKPSGKPRFNYRGPKVRILIPEPCLQEILEYIHAIYPPPTLHQLEAKRAAQALKFRKRRKRYMREYRNRTVAKKPYPSPWW